MDHFISNGNAEGIVITGITKRGVDLLERAIDKFGDVQSASLVMSYIIPQRFKDNRVEDWVEKYSENRGKSKYSILQNISVAIALF